MKQSMQQEILYDEAFQRQVLHLFATNTVFTNEYGILLNENCFSTTSLKAIFYLVNDYVTRYEVELSKNDLLLLVHDYASERGLSSESYKFIKEEVVAVYGSKPKSEQFVIDKVTDFVRANAVKAAILESIDVLSHTNDYSFVLKTIDAAVSTGVSLFRTCGMPDILTLPEKYKEKYDPNSLIKTGFNTYDTAMMGGMAPGEVHIIIGPPGSGKSTFGCNVGVHNVVKGKNVFHASLEIDEISVMKLYALRMSNMSHSDFLKISNEEWQKVMKRFAAYDNLFISHWPEGSINALTIRAWISQIRSTKNINPDLIIVDYDDCLIPISGKGEMYESGGEIYTDLINLANYFKCFTGDTEVMTNGFNRRLDSMSLGEPLEVFSIVEGQQVSSKGFALGCTGYTSHLIRITLEDSDYGGGVIECTPDHKIMLADYNKMVEAQDIVVGNSLRSIDLYVNRFKSLRIVKSVELVELDEPVPVYCINVPNIGNFALGNGVVVSNCPVMTFSQPQRGGCDKPMEDAVITMTDLAHSIRKAHKAFSVSSLNFKKGANKGTLFLDKCRRGQSSVWIPLERDLSKSLFQERVRDYNLEDDEGRPIQREKDTKKKYVKKDKAFAEATKPKFEEEDKSSRAGVDD